MKRFIKELRIDINLGRSSHPAACSFTGNVNSNAILGTSVVLVVLGLILILLLIRRIAD